MGIGSRDLEWFLSLQLSSATSVQPAVQLGYDCPNPERCEYPSSACGADLTVEDNESWRCEESTNAWPQNAATDPAEP